MGGLPLTTIGFKAPAKLPFLKRLQQQLVSASFRGCEEGGRVTNEFRQSAIFNIATSYHQHCGNSENKLKKKMLLFLVILYSFQYPKRMVVLSQPCILSILFYFLEHLWLQLCLVTFFSQTTKGNRYHMLRPIKIDPFIEQAHSSPQQKKKGIVNFGPIAHCRL